MMVVLSCVFDTIYSVFFFFLFYKFIAFVEICSCKPETLNCWMVMTKWKTIVCIFVKQKYKMHVFLSCRSVILNWFYFGPRFTWYMKWWLYTISGITHIYCGLEFQANSPFWHLIWQINLLQNTVWLDIKHKIREVFSLYFFSLSYLCLTIWLVAFDYKHFPPSVTEQICKPPFENFNL